MEKYGLDIPALQETKQLGNEIIDMGKNVFFKSGKNKRYFAVGFIVNKRFKRTVVDFKPISDRIIMLVSKNPGKI